MGDGDVAARRVFHGRPTTPHQPRLNPQPTLENSSVLPSIQFQALFHSRFQVLCIFPSRYLFAIGLSPVFSFGWYVPPTLRCTPKQRDSGNARRTRAYCLPGRGRDSHPLRCPIPRDLDPAATLTVRLEATIRHGQIRGDFHLELFSLHSPLLRESWLVSFPPLSDMLKFSG